MRSFQSGELIELSTPSRDFGMPAHRRSFDDPNLTRPPDRAFARSGDEEEWNWFQGQRWLDIESIQPCRANKKEQDD